MGIDTYNAIGVYLEVDKDLVEERDIFKDTCPDISCRKNNVSINSPFCPECGTKVTKIKTGTTKEMPCLWEIEEEFGTEEEFFTSPGELDYVYMFNKNIPNLNNFELSDKYESFAKDFSGIDIQGQIAIAAAHPQVEKFLIKFKEKYGKDSIALKYGIVTYYC